MLKTDTVKTVADVLYEKKLINSDQLAAIKFENVNTGKSIEQVVKDRGYVKAEDFAEALGAVYNVPFITLTAEQVDPSLMDLVPLNVAKKYRFVPFELKENKLSLAMIDPLDLQTIDFIERKTGYKVVPYITTEKTIEKVLEEQKGKELGEEITAALQEITETTLKIEETGGEITDATLRDAPIARIVSMILETAVKIGASDIHIEPGEDGSRLRYRVDGILEEKRKLPKEMHDSVIARIKILASMKIDEKRVPQDGRFKVQVGKSETERNAFGNRSHGFRKNRYFGVCLEQIKHHPCEYCYTRGSGRNTGARCKSGAGQSSGRTQFCGRIKILFKTGPQHYYGR